MKLKFKNLLWLVLSFTLLTLLSCNADDDNDKPQDCNNVLGEEYIGDIILKTQTDVDDFNLCVSKIRGFLVIDGSDITTDHIVDLSPLTSKIDTITRSLLIANLKLLKNIEGLNTIKVIGQSIIIENNDGLESIEGFPPTLVKIETDNLFGNSTSYNWPKENISKYRGILIQNNPKLKSLKGLHNVINVGNSYYGGGIRISNNDALINMEGLNSLAETHSFSVDFNGLVESLKGLDNFKRAAGSGLSIISNEMLKSFDGMDNLEGLGSLYVVNNPNLLEIEALSGVLGLGGGRDMYSWAYLRIKDNPLLESLWGLHNIKRIYTYNDGLSEILIDNNNSLIDLKGLDALEGVGGGGIYPKFIISNNRNLSSLAGLNNLKKLEATHSLSPDNAGYYFELNINNNPSLTNIDALSNLEVTSGKSIYANFKTNAVLNNFCGLENLVVSNTNPDFFILNTEENAFNPILEQLVNGECTN